jgi:pimeloyl-ACP methyl ester carboxylesterase
MPFETINGFRIHYEVHGEGEPVIFLHHGFGCSKIFKNVYPRFVTAGYKVVMFDRRGFGKSERDAGFEEFYESDRYRPDSVEELRRIKEILEIEECHLVGQCEGGVVGVDYSIKYPREVKTLTTASTQCYCEVTTAEMNARAFVLKFVDLAPALQEKMREWHGEAAEANYNQFTKQGGAYGTGYFDLRPVLPFVPCPTLVLFPDRSAIFEVEQSIAFYRSLIKGELAVFPKCGHNTYEQRPDDWSRTILDFLKRNTKGGQAERAATTCLA